MKAERIIQDAENERYKLLNESSLNKAMEEHAEKFRQTLFEECQQIKMAAFNEAQELRLSAKNDSMKMKEASQEVGLELLLKNWTPCPEWGLPLPKELWSLEARNLLPNRKTLCL